MVIDAHLHLTEEDVENNILQIMADNQIYGLVAATNPVESQWLRELAKGTPHVLPTYGLHPWVADRYDLAEMMPYLKSASCIGEIGMDSVWCDVDLGLQRKVFIAQMDVAEEKGCPVILHTKGQEKEVATIMDNYTMPILVHWYSCEDYLDFYMAKDCYFTVGPDVATSKAVQRVVKRVPVNRLLVESDGLSALEWVRGEKVEAGALPACLMETMIYVAKEKELSFDEVEAQMAENLKSWGIRI